MLKFLKNLFSKKADDGSSENQGDERPQLVNATSYKEGDVGSAEWSIEHNAEFLSFSNKNQTVEWKSKSEQAAFLPSTTSLHLHSGKYTLDFSIEEMGSAQIGVGFMLLWENDLLDWGFYGYLGAGMAAWSYDPSTGDVVSGSNSIQGGLPVFENKVSGTVTIELNLPRNAQGEGKFIVNGIESHSIPLPMGAVIVPAATFLEKGQKITLANFKKH